MTDIPIIFSAAMVRALLEGRKTMTRRLAWQVRTVWTNRIPIGTQIRPSPWQKAKPGDRLYVRESHWRYGQWIGRKSGGKIAHRFAASSKGLDSIVYAEDENLIHPTRRGKFASADNDWHMRPSIFMPRELSRLTLIITETKVERLQSISEQDCEREGLWSEKAGQKWVYAPSAESKWQFEDPRDAFCNLWSELHGEESWRENPEVVAITFSVHQANIDSMKEAA